MNVVGLNNTFGKLPPNIDLKYLMWVIEFVIDVRTHYRLRISLNLNILG